MAKYRAPSESSKYYLPKEEYLTVVHFSLQYPRWVDELRTVADTRRAITYDADKVQSSFKKGVDETSGAALRAYALTEKIKKVRDSAKASAPEHMVKWLILSVCHDMSFYQLVDRGMICSRRFYTDMRARYYFELSKKI